MKMYKVFECEGYTFKWAGGCTINVYWDGMDEGYNKVDDIEFYHTYTDKEVAILCLDWLEDNGTIDDVEAYII